MPPAVGTTAAAGLPPASCSKRACSALVAAAGNIFLFFLEIFPKVTDMYCIVVLVYTDMNKTGFNTHTHTQIP